MNRQQIKILSNLRPETVVALEGVPFASRALALPGVLEARESLYEVAFIGEVERDEVIDVMAAMRIPPDTEERMVVMEKFIVAGALYFDDDAEHCNPFLEQYGNGRLFHRGRRAGRGEEVDFHHALGCDEDGNKALGDESVSDQLVEHVVALIRGNRSLMATLSNLLRSRGKAASWRAVLDTVTDAVFREGWEFALDYIAERFLDVPWWNRLASHWRDKLDGLASLLCESAAEAAWERARAAGTIGHPLAVLLDIYEHGGVVYSVSGGGMQCRWDTTRRGAVWVPDEGAESDIRTNVLRDMGLGDLRWFGTVGSEDEPPVVRYTNDGGRTWSGAYRTEAAARAAMLEASGLRLDPTELAGRLTGEAERYCRGVLDEYNAWVNGEVYGVAVYVLDRATGMRIKARDEEFWGVTGSEHAEGSLEEAVLSAVMCLARPMH